MVEELVSAGYPRGDILDAAYSLDQKGDEVNLASVMRELERKKTEFKIEKKEEIPEEISCKICFEAVIDSVFVPCGHLCVCMDCGKSLKICPMCRNPVTQIIKTFKA